MSTIGVGVSIVWVLGSLGGKVSSLSSLDGKGLGGGDSSISVGSQTDGGVSTIVRSIVELGIGISLSLTLANDMSTIGVGVSVVWVVKGLGGQVGCLSKLDGESLGGGDGSVGISGQTSSGMGVSIDVWASIQELSIRLGNCDGSESEKSNLLMLNKYT